VHNYAEKPAETLPLLNRSALLRAGAAVLVGAVLAALWLNRPSPSASSAYFHPAAGLSGLRITVAPDVGWQPQLPAGQVLGQVSSVAVDAEDHLWVLHRPGTVPVGATAAPALMQLAPDGSVLAAIDTPVGTWPQSEHGVFIGPDGSLWVTGNGETDADVLHLVIDDKGDSAWQAVGNHSLGAPADVWVDARTGIAYVADGYKHRRVAGFDATTGAAIGEWFGAGQAFGLPVHCVNGTSDHRLYVCDRAGNRLQVFDIGEDGNLTWRSDIAPAPRTGGNGSVWDVAFSPDETLLYIADGQNERVWVVDRATEAVIGYFGNKGHAPGQFSWLHHLDVDSAGNLYTTEVGDGRRVQKFTISVQRS